MIDLVKYGYKFTKCNCICIIFNVIIGLITMYNFYVQCRGIYIDFFRKGDFL